MSTEAVAASIGAACARIAPLWPLKRFVAVNPFLGFTDQPFAAACAAMRRIADADMLMPRAYYREALADGTLADADLATALARLPGHGFAGPAAVRAALAQDRPPRRANAVVATVAEVLDSLAAGDRYVSRTAFMVDEISRWCAAYFDEGQSAWKAPWRDMQPYPAWKAAMRYDRNPETMGINGFRAAVASMPEEPEAAIAAVAAALGIPSHALTDYLHRALFDIGGWAAYVRYLDREDGREARLVHLLAIRVVWGYALFRQHDDPVFKQAWAAAMAAVPAAPGEDLDLAPDLIAQAALEVAYQRRLFAGLRTPLPRPAPAVQAAFCIDVRSETLRRALEDVSPAIETIGFAGFFGYPIEYVPIGAQRGSAQCPVLLKPAFIVCEAVEGTAEEEAETILGLRLLRRRVAKAWKAFKTSAVSSFTYVEAAGPSYAAKIVADSAGWTRPVPDPQYDGLGRAVIGRLGPRLEPRLVAERETGFTLEQRLRQAEAVLRAMSLTRGFARLVLLAGHGAATVNNPHASGLDCGACGGHTGEANARVAASVLNDPAVRAGLSERGIVIPADTWFLAGLHDTVTDAVKLFDLDAVPDGLRPDVATLQSWLAQARGRARRERANWLGGDPAIARRGRDWSQVRPEWGLARNAAFIAAPRARTQGSDLGGRVFLHSYDWRDDAGFQVLALIMTAPMVVAHWINMQYYASTVNNRRFGAGNKVLHNIVGTIGVLQGNGGDLQTGLPWQSVHDGERFVHEPLRLTVLIEAPRAPIEDVIAREAGVRDLIRNDWLHLFAIADDGTVARYAGPGRWQDA